MKLTHTLIFCLLTVVTFAQGWVKTFDLGNYESGEQITLAADGNLLLMGHFDLGEEGTFILKTNLVGDSLTSFIVLGIEAIEFLEASDGHFWLTGQSEDLPFLIKVDESGAVLFTVNFTESGKGLRIKEMANGDILWTGLEGNHPSKRKFAADGTLLEWQLFEQYANNVVSYSAINNGAEIFFAQGINEANGNAAIKVIKINEANEILWESIHPVSNGCTSGVNFLQALPDEGVIMVVNKQCTNWATPFLEAYKFDGNGEKSPFGGYGHFQQYPWYTDIFPLSENAYVFTGNTQFFANSWERYGLLGRIENGNNFTTLLFPNEGGQYEIGGIVPVSDSCYYLIAQHYPGVALIKTDQYGQLTNSNYLTGQLFDDENNNCELDNEEVDFENWTVEFRNAMGDILTTQISDENGQFAFQADTGSYQITAIPPDSNWVACADPFILEFTDFFDTVFVELGWRDTCPDFTNAFQFNSICGEGTGEILIESTGSNGNFSYQWSNGDVGNVAQNLATGQYFVTIENDNCVYLDSVEMSFPKTFKQNNFYCFGGSQAEKLTDAAYLNDGSMVLFGNTSSKNGDVSSNFGLDDFWLTKVDSTGEIMWENSFGTPFQETASRMIATSDNGFILVGHFTQTFDVFPNPNTDAVVVKVDANGQQEWMKNYGTTETDIGYDIIETNDGNYVFVGNRQLMNNMGQIGCWVVKIDTEGEVIWERIFGEANTDSGNAIAETSNGDLVVTGKFGTSEMALKLNANGDLLWQNTFPVPNYLGENSDVLVLPNDEIIMQSLLHHTRKLTTDGNIVWEIDLTKDESQLFHRIEPAMDGGFWITKQDYNTGNGPPAIFSSLGVQAGLVKIDALGNVEFEYNLTGEKADKAVRFFQKNDQNFILCGDTKSQNFHFKRGANLFSQDYFMTELEGPFAKVNLLPQDTFVCLPSTQNLSIQSPLISIDSIFWEDGTTAVNRMTTVVSDTVFSAILTSEEGCQANETIFFVGDRLEIDEALYHPNCAEDNGGIQILPVRNLFLSNDWLGNAYQVFWETGDTTFVQSNLAPGSYAYTLTDEFCAKSGIAELEMSNTPGKIWETTFDLGIGSSGYQEIETVIQGADGDFYAIGDGKLIKSSPQGDSLWQKPANGIRDVFPLANGNLLVTGATSHLQEDTLFVAIHNSENEQLQRKIFLGNTDKDSGIKIMEATDGAIFMLAHTRSSGGDFSGNNGGLDYTLFKMDENLNLIWSKNYGTSNSEYEGLMELLPNGDIIVGGIAEIADFDVPTIYGKEDVWLFRVSGENGEVVWSKNYGGTETEDLTGLKYNNGQILVSINSNSFDYDLLNPDIYTTEAAFIFTLDLDGNIQNRLQLGANNSIQDFEIAPDGNLVVTHYKYNSGVFLDEYQLSKIMLDGTILWSKKFRYGRKSQILLTQNGGYLRVHYTTYMVNPMQFPTRIHFTNFVEGTFPPLVPLPADTMLCIGDSLQITTDFYPELTYNWSNGAAGNELIFTEPGLYELTVSTVPQCSNTDEMLIDICTDFTLPSPVATCDSTLVDAGFEGANYLWNNGDTTKMTYFHESGWATVEMNYADNTVLIDSVFVEVIDNNLILQSEFSDSICYNSDAGFIDVNANVGNVNYSWNTGATTEDLTNLSSGNYELTAVDSLGCRQQVAFEINELSELKVWDYEQEPFCFPDSTGQISLVPSGSSAPYQFAWTTGDLTDTISNLPVGIYGYTVTDSRGCTRERTVELDAEYNPKIVINDLNHPTTGQSNGSITLGASEAFFSYEFTWADGATGNERVNLPAGSYDVTLTDAQGCFDTETIVLEVINATSAIEESSISIYPNPFEEAFFIDFKNNKTAIANIEIYNILGQKMAIDFNRNLEKRILKIGTKEWSSGTYFIQYQMGSEIFIKKMVKQ